MARSDPQLNFRIPEALKSQLEEAAAKSGRSVTAELIHRLTGSFESRGSAHLVTEPARAPSSMEIELTRQIATVRSEVLAEIQTANQNLAAKFDAIVAGRSIAAVKPKPAAKKKSR